MILLTSGSSFSFDYPSSVDDDEDCLIKKWPSILSEKLDLRLVNRSKYAASNMFIYDHLMENIIKYGNDIELVVASWTYGFKASIFRNYEINFVNMDDQDCDDDELIGPATIIRDKILSNGLLLSSIDQTLRLMIYLQDTCDAKGIKCIHYPLLNIFKSTLDTAGHVKLLEQIINSDNFQRVQYFDNVIGWPCDIVLGGSTYNTLHSDHVISETNHHPNAKGQEIIAETVYNKYLEMKTK